jgi:hypothetical protein
VCSVLSVNKTVEPDRPVVGREEAVPVGEEESEVVPEGEEGVPEEVGSEGELEEMALEDDLFLSWCRWNGTQSMIDKWKRRVTVSQTGCVEKIGRKKKISEPVPKTTLSFLFPLLVATNHHHHHHRAPPPSQKPKTEKTSHSPPNQPANQATNQRRCDQRRQHHPDPPPLLSSFPRTRTHTVSLTVVVAITTSSCGRSGPPIPPRPDLLVQQRIVVRRPVLVWVD